MKWSKLYNPLMIGLLRSPLHGLVSRWFMLVTFTGRKSGRTFTTPVEHFRIGDDIAFLTRRERRWWRNLQHGAPVTLRLHGHDVRGTATTSAGDPAHYRAALEAYLTRYPNRLTVFGASRDETGGLHIPAPEEAVAQTVIVRVTPERAIG
ncbi:MAG: nitroreductase/quinone reductase family protein [Anaerolineae bacterium]